MLLCTKWIITREQIKIYQGVLSKRINYIELYRVYDYEEKQSFIQSLINNTNIYIYSGDKSTPELLMNGLKANVIKRKFFINQYRNLGFNIISSEAMFVPSFIT